MDYDFSIEEMIKRLAEFPPKTLREKVCPSSEKRFFYYSNSLMKENIYNYVASLTETEIRALFDNAAKRGSNILKPCCNICIHVFLSMYEDIPGSHVNGWWQGECGLDEKHRKISSTQNKPSPEWCPLNKKEN